jgi:elongation factor Ts
MTTVLENIKQLHQETGACVLACRLALEQESGNFNNALLTLREKAAADAARKADRPASQGRIEIYSHANGRIGVMVEVNTETDFAARSEAFRSFVHEIALQVAAASPLYVRDADIPADVLSDLAEKAAGRARNEGKPERLLARIQEGVLEKYRDRMVLLRQTYIRDDQVTIQQLLNQAIATVRENIVIRRFERWELVTPETEGE